MINNLKLEFGEKGLDYLNGEVHRLRVVLKNDDGAYYPVFFEPDKINLSDAELYQMALEVNYQKNSSGRAEDERFNTIGEKIAEIDAATSRSKELYSNVEKMMKITTAVGNELIASMMGGKGGTEMMINHFAMQVQLEWITLEQVPKRYLEKVRELL